MNLHVRMYLVAALSACSFGVVALQERFEVSFNQISMSDYVYWITWTRVGLGEPTVWLFF